MATPHEPECLLCPISRQMFRDPVCVFPGGQTYDRPSINAWIGKNGATDPLTKTAIKSIATNWALRKCIEHWLDVNDETPGGWESRALFSSFENDIHALASRGEVKAIIELMEGLDEQEKKSLINLEIGGKTPLLCAVESDVCSVELVDVILRFGADLGRMYYCDEDRFAFHPRLKKNSQYSILHKAACYCDASVIERILREPQVDNMVQASDGSLPFMWATLTDNLEAVDILVRDFDAFDHNDEQGFTALHEAVSIPMLEYLFSKARSAWNNEARFENYINSRSYEGNTPLHHFSWCGDIKIAKYLVETGGAKLDIVNAAGETALAHGLRSDFNEDYIKKGLVEFFCDHHGMVADTGIQ